MVNQAREKTTSTLDDKKTNLSKKVWNLEGKKEAKRLPTKNGSLPIEQIRKMPEAVLIESDFQDTSVPPKTKFFIKQGGRLFSVLIELTEE